MLDRPNLTTITMNWTNALPAFIGALVAGLFTATGWYVTKQKEEKSRRREISLRYLQRQIEEFYGPLFGFILQSGKVYDIARKMLPTDETSKRLNIYHFSAEQNKIW